MGKAGTPGEPPLKFDVTVNGRPWRVALEPIEPRGRFEVSLKGKRRVFDAAWIDAGTLSLIDAEAGARVHELGIRARPSTTSGQPLELDVAVAGTVFRVQALAEGRPGQRHRLEHEPATVEGRQSVVTPMPGRVVRILVAPGDRVAAQQAVAVVEAMKMENELRSPKDGVVREVGVREGQAIDAGTVLVVIE